MPLIRASHQNALAWRSFRGWEMLWVTDDVRKLAEQLTASSYEGRGAKLTPASVNIALAALRAHRDKLTSPPATEAIVSFQIEVLDSMGLPREVLGTATDERVAHTALAEAKKRFPRQKIVLRGKTSSGERIDPAD
jgi:hypothetical protein